MSIALLACDHCRGCRECEPLWPDIDLSAYEAVPAINPTSFTVGETSFGKGTLDFVNVKPAGPVDYWELRGMESPFSDIFGGMSTLLVGVGTKCQGANNKGPCLAQFEGFQTIPESDQLNPSHEPIGYGLPDKLGEPSIRLYIVSSEGDAVHLWDTKQKLLEFLGTIDSREKAVLVAVSNGFALAQDRKDLSAIREAPDGYEMIARRENPDHIGGDRVDRVVIHISPDGNVRSLREQKWYETTDCD